MTARLPVTVSSVQTWFYMYAYVKKSSPGSTQLPTSRHLLSPPTCATMTHTHTHIHTRINRLWSPLAYGLGGNNRLWSPLAYGLGGNKIRVYCPPVSSVRVCGSLFSSPLCVLLSTLPAEPCGARSVLLYTCICSTSSSSVPLLEDHLLSCHGLGVAIWHHNDLRQTMRDMAMAAGFPVEE